MTQVVGEHLYKIFGNDPDRARSLIEQGKTRNEIQEETGQVAAVVDASISVEKGSIFMIMGLSGSGKSTLLRLINRLIEPTYGTVYIDGDDISKLSAKELRELRARRISMVFQRFALFPHRTVLENAAFGLEIQRRPEEEREKLAREALESVGLAGWENNFPEQLSGGMQQRVGLARALATQPEILLMDEPFSALDPLIRREMQEQLLELQSELGVTIIFVTHDLNEAMMLGDAIAVMRDGWIVQQGSALDILERPANDYVASFIADVDRSRVITVETVMEDSLVTASADDPAHQALEILEKGDTSAVYVTEERSDRVVGVVDREALTERPDGRSTTLSAAMIEDFPRVTRDTVIGEVFGMAAESPLPIAVVDDEGNVLGVVSREALLEAAKGVTAPNDS